MKVAIMQPYLFPYIGYFQLMAITDQFVFLDDVAYINRGWINRNRILVNGKDLMFTIPLKGASQNKLISELETDIDEKWKTKFFKTIEMAYKRAPYYAQVTEILRSVFSGTNQRLTDMAIDSFTRINAYLGIKTKLIPTSHIYNCGSHRGQERILCIVETIGAKTYVNALGGRDIYDLAEFQRRGITLNFLEPYLPQYTQNAPQFINGLSIIDVMMHNSPEVIHGWVMQGKLVN